MRAVKKIIGRSLLWLLGWKVEAEGMDEPKAIMVGYPHTSSWDFPIFILTMWRSDMCCDSGLLTAKPSITHNGALKN